MPSSTLLRSAAGIQVWRLIPDTRLTSYDLMGVRGVPLYRAQPARVSDVPQALLEQPCQHRLGYYEHGFMERRFAHARSGFFLWSDLRRQFPDTPEGYNEAIQVAAADLDDTLHGVWVCYTCGLNPIMAIFSFPEAT